MVRPFLRLALVAVAVTPAACFLGYDSSWGQAKAAQKRLAAQATPGAIAAADDDSHRTAPRRTYRIRLRPDAQYLAQTVDPERQIGDLVEDADRVLEASLGLRLEVETTKPWSFDADEHLDIALAALRRDDPGDDVDVVVGLIGALPRPTESLHEVGYAEVLGKHLVVRAASRLGEHDAVDRALTELSDDERDRVVRARRRHRAEAVFLHELGHVLGALHEGDVTSLMHPAYDEKMKAFGDDAVILMRLALDETDRPSVVRAQLDYLRGAKTSAWGPGERDMAVKHLEAMLAPTPAPTPDDSAPVAPVALAGAPELQPSDRDRLARATEMFRAGAVPAAYELARPLFTAYPNTFVVQDLRCELATVRWLDKAALLAECAPSTRLADAGAGSKD
ncbi:MAG TPA: matrixin family metalloprotease [Polyangiaceae bacterium]|nr:matrixin family metalloprotease [Polyangiaceae bacterium]